MVEERDLSDFTRRQGDKTTISFVGVVLDSLGAIVSLPKHFYPISFWQKKERLDKELLLSDLSDLFSILARGSSTSNKGELTNFPIDSYIKIQDYYKKYGLFTKKSHRLTTGYSGNVHWRETFNKSQKILQENGILYLPFQLKKNINVHTFISECMEYVLSETYTEFRNFLSFAIPYRKKTNNQFFNNHKRCKAELIGIKNMYFKDTEKDLIDALISYFDWLTRRDNKIVIATKNFELYWEALVAVYLDIKFDSITSNGQIIFGDNKKGDFYFKPALEEIEDEKILRAQGRKGFSIGFDHIRYDKNCIVLFDSKYTNDDTMKSFNYKQAFYYYYLKSMYPSSEIINGLILPTSSNYRHSVHVDRARNSIYDIHGNVFVETNKSKVDGLKIIEHNLNLRNSISISASNITHFLGKIKRKN
ncbi:hypothetical protein HO466_00160 [Streptococcus suis]|nr:hypothetical protein [Streptococcus suis]